MEVSKNFGPFGILAPLAASLLSPVDVFVLDVFEEDEEMAGILLSLRVRF
jgi:threonine dehydrogenase-like Zn-dependent dehydrogenase